jgi:hypothetical protein
MPFRPDPEKAVISADRMKKVAEEMGATDIYQRWFGNRGDAA